MNVQQSTYGALHHRTQSKFPSLQSETKVFIARQGPRILGTAFVKHHQLFTSFYHENRQIECTVDARNESARQALIQSAREYARPLKRRFAVTGTPGMEKEGLDDSVLFNNN
jgi:hypothetical protein